MSALPQIILVSRIKLRPSPLQPRQIFDEDHLNELGASIRSATGFINALVVRPCSPDEQHPHAEYEIIAGECRWRASDERPDPATPGRSMAAIEEVPVVVREMSDQLALEMMLAENMKRGDLNDVEQSDAFVRALAQKDAEGRPIYRTAADLAKAIGVSADTVERRLLLQKLPDTGRRLMITGDLSFAVARVICKCPAKIVPDVLKQVMHPDEHEVWLPGIGYVQDPLNAEQTEQLISERFMRRLDHAAFDLESEQLLPEVVDGRGERVEGGACKGCPWNSDPSGDGPKPKHARHEGKKRHCLNPACFTKKIARHKAIQIAAAEVAGHTVVTGEQAEKILHGSPAKTLAYGWVDLDEEVSPDDLSTSGKKGQAPKWRDVVGGEATAKVVVGRTEDGDALKGEVKGAVAVPITVVVDERTGKLHHVVEKKVAVAAAAKTEHAPKLSLSAGGGGSVQGDDEKEKRRRELEEARLANGILMESMGALVQAVETMKLSDEKLCAQFWRYLAAVASWHGGSDAVNFVTRRRGLPGEDAMVAVAHAGKELKNPHELRGFAVELLLGRLVKNSGVGERNFDGLCKLLKVDVRGIERKLRAASAKEAKAKKAAEKAAEKAAAQKKSSAKPKSKAELTAEQEQLCLEEAVRLRLAKDDAALNSQDLARKLNISSAKGAKIFKLMLSEVRKRKIAERPQAVGEVNGVPMPFVWYDDRILFVEEFDGFHVTLEDPALPRRTSGVCILEWQVRELHPPTLAECSSYKPKNGKEFEWPDRLEERLAPDAVDRFLTEAKTERKEPSPPKEPVKKKARGPMQTLGKKIIAVLMEAGKPMATKEIVAATKASWKNVAIWFATHGRKVAEIQKTAPATYRWNPIEKKS